MGQGCLGTIAIVAIIIGLAGAGYYYSTPRQNLSSPPQTVQPTSTLTNLGQGNPEDTSMKQGTFEFEPPPVKVCKNIDISIVIDISGSMGENINGVKKIEYAKQAASTLATTLASKQSSDPNTVNGVRLGVISFGRQGDVNDPLLGDLVPEYTPKTKEHMILTGNLVAVANAVASMNETGGYTCIQCGLHVANRQFGTEANDRMKVVILLSDGIANRVWPGSDPGSAVSKQKAIEQANLGRDSLGIEYRVVGFGEGNEYDPNTLQAIAGSADNYQYMTDPTQWTNAFLTVLEDICGLSNTVN